MVPPNRRHFLRTAGAGLGVGLGLRGGPAGLFVPAGIRPERGQRPPRPPMGSP